MDYCDRASNNEFTGINLGLSLLYLKKTSGNFLMICHLHKFHSHHLYTGHVKLLLDKFLHILSNSLTVSHKRRFSTFSSIWKLRANSSHDFKSLVWDVLLKAVDGIVSFNCINNPIVNDSWYIHRRTTGIRYWRAFELQSLDLGADIKKGDAAHKRIKEAAGLRFLINNLSKCSIHSNFPLANLLAANAYV